MEQNFIYRQIRQEIIVTFEGIVSRDFWGLQMIFMDRTWVPAILLKVYYFKFTISYCFLLVQHFPRVKLLLLYFAKA